jgi:hypothetical protein
MCRRAIWSFLVISCCLASSSWAAPARRRAVPRSVEAKDTAASRDNSAASTAEDIANAKVVAEISAGVASRYLGYSDAAAGGLRDHVAPAIAVYGVGAELYPAAGTGIPFAKDIGIVGRYSSSLSVDSQSNDGGQNARGVLQRYALGARGRLRLGDSPSSPVLGLEGTYGAWAFVFEGADPAVALALSVDYKYLRGGADVRLPIGLFGLFAGGGYMSILSAGPFSDRFPRATIGGVDITGGASYALASFVDLRASVVYTRIFSSAHADLDAAYVAGGALDQYVAFNLGASAIF